MLNKISFHLALSSKCNLRCKYCFKDLNYNDASIEDCKNIIDRIFAIYEIEEIESINLFSTSEPFFNENKFWDLYNYIIEKGLICQKISFTTNGTKDLTKYLDKLKQRGYILISFDGNKDIQLANRCNIDQFNILCNNVGILSKSGVRCIASTVICADKSSIFDNSMFLRSLGFDKVSFKIVKKPLSTDDVGLIVKKYVDFYIELEDRIINKNEIYWIYFFGLGELFSSVCQKNIPIQCEKYAPHLMVIDNKGNVFKCDYDTNNKGYGVYANIFDDKFNKYTFDNNIRNIETRRKVVSSECLHKCPAMYICGGPNNFCEKLDIDCMCSVSRAIWPYVCRILKYLLASYNSEELNYIFCDERISFLSKARKSVREKFLNLDKIYNSDQLKVQLSLGPLNEEE